MVDKLQDFLSMPTGLDDEHVRRQEEDNVEYLLSLLPRFVQSTVQVALADFSLVESFLELSSEPTAAVLGRHRATSATLFKATPDVFPFSHPFALLSELPPPSLLDKRVTAADPIPSSGTFICSLAESAAVIFSLVLAAPRSVTLRWLQEMVDFEGAKTTSSMLQTIFQFCTSIIDGAAFPPSWLTLNLMSLGSIIRLLDPITDLLEKHFVPHVDDLADFDVDLWRNVLQLVFAFCGNRELVLEDMTQQRRRAQWIIAGDLRDDGAALLLRLWGMLGWEDAHGGLRYGGVSLSGAIQAEYALMTVSNSLYQSRWSYSRPMPLEPRRSL